MVRRSFTTTLVRAYQRNLRTLTKATEKGAARALAQTTKGIASAAAEQRKPPSGDGDWLSGITIGPAGVRRYYLFRPEGLNLRFGETLPLMVMLHGCTQNARDFAAITRMNRLATRHRFLVLYPEQDRLAHSNACWNWYNFQSGKALAEATTLMAAIDQVCLLYRGDLQRVAVAGLSAGASMAALLATYHPVRFKAVIMHSGIAPGAAKSPKMLLGAMRGLHMPPSPAAPGTLLPPLLVLHGGRDIVISHRNAAGTAGVWAVATGARPVATRTLQRGRRHAMRVTDFKRGNRVMVTLCDIAELGHAWSGGAAKFRFSDPAGPDATRLTWAFAAKQFDFTQH